ncbi:MAG: copper-translocating P-type ATPase [Asgard group archaeon]|nr:copper-translocating P-type ATPase [Asgard group archaeon]
MSNIEKKTVSVEGMHCAACVTRVEKALSSVEGINSAAVNLLSNSAQIFFDPSIVKDKQIKKAVESAGYKVSFDNVELSYMKNTQLIDMRKRFLWSLGLALPVFVFAMGHMLPFRLWFDGFANWQQTFFIFRGMTFSNFIQLILTTPIQFIIAFPFYRDAWKSLKAKSASMDVLVVLGTSAAYFYSLFSLIYPYINTSYHGEVFFETSAILLTFIFLGKYLEEVTKGRTSEAIKKLIELRPNTATVIRENKEVEIPIDDVKNDDICLIHPGDSVPVDGIVTEGQSYVNEAMITGESIAVFKEKDSELIGGTINENGFLKMKATRIGKDTTLNQIIKMVEEAQTSKLPIQKLADKISAIFVPVVVLASILTFTIWFALFQTGVISSTILPDGVSMFLFAFLTGITVLVISCPCALGLATPTAIMVGTGLGASDGILIRSGTALEVARQVDVVLLDKTGTITEGKPVVTDIVSFNDFQNNQLLQIASSMEKGSEHSIAKAIVSKSEELQIELKDIDNFIAHPGKGIESSVEGTLYYFGNRKIAEDSNVSISEEISSKMEKLENDGKTVMILFSKDSILGLIAIADTIKQTSKEAIQELLKLGLSVVMVSGDNIRSATSIAKEVGIEEIHAEVVPSEKVDVVKKYQAKNQKVLFVGDGVNDSPALAQSDVGIAIGSGSDVAIEAGDIVLIKDDLKDAVTAIDLSKKTIRKVKLGLFWALIYNVIGIPIAAGILFIPFGFLLPAEIAGLAMALSSVSVVLNALLLKRYKNPFYSR